MLSSNQFYIFGYFNSLPPCLNFWLSFLLLKCMAAIIFSIGNNTCSLLSDHHFKSYLETINHRERERKRETERDRETERQRDSEWQREREIIPNSSSKLLQDKWFQTILINYYQRIISNNTYKLLSENPNNNYKLLSED